MTGVVGPDADTPRNRVDEEERVKANAMLSLARARARFATTLARLYTGKEQSSLSTTREIGSSLRSIRQRARVRGLSIRAYARTHATHARPVRAGWSIVGRKLRKRKLAGVTVTGADVSHVLLRFCNQ